MDNVREMIKAGNLAEARKCLNDKVKSSPSDFKARTLLFQVLAFYGEWDKAQRQLELVAGQDMEKDLGAQVYLNLVQAEKERLEAYQGKKPPSFVPELPAYFDTYENARKKMEQAEWEQAETLFSQVEAQRPLISGTLNGQTFSGIRDTDSCLAYFLEVFAHTRYLRVPFECIRELSIEPPKTLLDLLWIPGRITTWEGLTLNGFLPTLYAESWLQENDLLKLGHSTEWLPLGNGFSRGMGQHVFEIGDQEIGLLEIREMVFNNRVPLENKK